MNTQDISKILDCAVNPNTSSTTYHFSHDCGGEKSGVRGSDINVGLNSPNNFKRKQFDGKINVKTNKHLKRVNPSSKEKTECSLQIPTQWKINAEYCVEYLEKAGETFLQDGPCFKVAPRLPKCQECKWTAQGSTSKILCRFYAFRRLRYTKTGNVAMAGFLDPYKDVKPEDFDLWLPKPLTSPKDLETNLFLLQYVSIQFCQLLKQEREAQILAKTKNVAWKRMVKGVREMCDVCKTTLFNFHWVCSKCGFVACIDCYKSRMIGLSQKWLICTNGRGHCQDNLMLTQIIPGDCLETLRSKLNKLDTLSSVPFTGDTPTISVTQSKEPNSKFNLEKINTLYDTILQGHLNCLKSSTPHMDLISSTLEKPGKLFLNSQFGGDSEMLKESTEIGKTNEAIESLQNTVDYCNGYQLINEVSSQAHILQRFVDSHWNDNVVNNDQNKFIKGLTLPVNKDYSFKIPSVQNTLNLVDKVPNLGSCGKNKDILHIGGYSTENNNIKDKIYMNQPGCKGKLCSKNMEPFGNIQNNEKEISQHNDYIDGNPDINKGTVSHSIKYFQDDKTQDNIDVFAQALGYTTRVEKVLNLQQVMEYSNTDQLRGEVEAYHGVLDYFNYKHNDFTTTPLAVKSFDGKNVKDNLINYKLIDEESEADQLVGKTAQISNEFTENGLLIPHIYKKLLSNKVYSCVDTTKVLRTSRLSRLETENDRAIVQFKYNLSDQINHCLKILQDRFSQTLMKSKLLYPDVPHSWLCSGRLLHLHKPNHPGNFKLFQHQWRQGQPVLVSDVTNYLDKNLWHPDSFIRDFGDTPNVLVNCMTGQSVHGCLMREFWDGFKHASKRLKDKDGKPMLLKLKDWPPGDDFAEMLPSRYQNLMKVLPMGEYTGRSGRLNLVSSLPDSFVPPDLGPKMYSAYGSVLHPSKGSTNLHLDVSDAVNVLVYVGVSDNSITYTRALYQLIDKACSDKQTRRVRKKTRIPGALWHIYAASDATKIRSFLSKVAVESGRIVRPHEDPIHDQNWYLDTKLRDRLLTEYGVEGCTIVQCLGDAIFIPAGAPHQVQNLNNCIKVAEDFVSPENISHCFHLMCEFRELSDIHLNHEDKLQVKNIIYHVVKDALSALSIE